MYKVRSGLFWYIYTTDRALALRLGRAPVIQDWDIDIPRTFSFEGIMGTETTGVALMWLKSATLQGQIYEQLSVAPGATQRRAKPADNPTGIAQTLWREHKPKSSNELVNWQSTAGFWRWKRMRRGQ